MNDKEKWVPKPTQKRTQLESDPGDLNRAKKESNRLPVSSLNPEKPKPKGTDKK